MEIKTTMTTCPNGHHYDSAKYASCPFCGSQAGSFTPTEAPGAGAGSGGFSPTEPLGGAGGYSAGFTPTEAPVAAGVSNPNFGATMAPENNRSWGSAPDPFSQATTIGGSDRADGDQTEPVVGWLVCIEGPVRGTDYRIHAGYNYIGREVGDIHIRGDQQISRQNHAMIAYDSSDHLYYVGPSAGRNLIKVNGKTVLTAVEIKNYDVISIGTTKLIFVGLCGEKFSWDKRDGGNA